MKQDDYAQLSVEMFTENAIRNAKKPTKDTSKNEHCLNCKEPVEKGHAFCDSDCREDHEWRQERRQHRPR